MADTRKYNLGGNCAIAAAVGYIIVRITFFSIPQIQRGSQGRLQLTEYFNFNSERLNSFATSILEFQFCSIDGACSYDCSKPLL